jgi:hypothetical protein
MILADTSVWIDHFRKPGVLLGRLLDRDQVLAHPFVIGEIALGNLQNGVVILDSLRSMKAAAVASDAEVMSFIESHSLAGKGIGYIDAHLMASVKLMAGTMLWTRDKRLQSAAASLKLEMMETEAP